MIIMLDGSHHLEHPICSNSSECQESKWCWIALTRSTAHNSCILTSSQKIMDHPHHHLLISIHQHPNRLTSWWMGGMSGVNNPENRPSLVNTHSAYILYLKDPALSTHSAWWIVQSTELRGFLFAFHERHRINHNYQNYQRWNLYLLALCANPTC